MIGFPAVYGGHSTLMSPTAFVRRPLRTERFAANPHGYLERQVRPVGSQWEPGAACPTTTANARHFATAFSPAVKPFHKQIRTERFAANPHGYLERQVRPVGSQWEPGAACPTTPTLSKARAVLLVSGLLAYLTTPACRRPITLSGLFLVSVALAAAHLLALLHRAPGTPTLSKARAVLLVSGLLAYLTTPACRRPITLSGHR